MRIIFLGTPQIALNVFETLIANHEIVAVLTQPDKPIKRSKKNIESPIAERASFYKIPIYKSEKIDDEIIRIFRNLEADVFVTFAFGVILPRTFLDITRLGGINIHPSLLPKLRGPSPLQSAILQGLNKTGITIQTIKYKVDSGDILLQKELDIYSFEDLNSLEDRVSKIASEMILQVLEGLDKGTLTPRVQNEENATYCKMIKKEDGLIDWNCSSKDIVNKIRSFSKWPVAYNFVDGKRLSIHRAKLNDNLIFDNFLNSKNGEVIFSDKSNGVIVKASDGLVNLLMLQFEGKNILDCKCFINGCKDFIGKILS